MTIAKGFEDSTVNATPADALPSMFQAVSGLQNLRAALAMLSCFALSVFASGFLWILLGKGAAAFLLSGLLAVFMVLSGIHAGGLLLMDQAKRLPMRSLSEAIVSGMWCVPKSILLAIGLSLSFIVVYLLIALLFFVCKMPGLGTLLYGIVFPAAVIVSGLTFTGLFMGMMIALAALWEGATVAGALLKAFSVLSTRLVETALLSFVVLVLASLVFFFVGGVLMTGFMPALGLSVSILGASPQMFGSFGSLVMGVGDSGGLGGYALAGSFGSALLFALTMTLVFQVWLLGVNLLYLKVTEGLEASAREGLLQKRLAEAGRKAAEMGNKAKQAAGQAREQASLKVERSKGPIPEPSLGPEELAVAPAQLDAATGSDADLDIARPSEKPQPHCPACAGDVLLDDFFCGTCGHRLKT